MQLTGCISPCEEEWLTTTDISYDVDGSTMIGRLALPEGEGIRPAILIGHEGNGLDDYQLS